MMSASEFIKIMINPVMKIGLKIWTIMAREFSIF